MKKDIFCTSHDPFIIAEAGVNHNGKLPTALALVDVAADAGADAVKFQTFKAEQVVTDLGKMATYQKKNIGKTMSQRDMLRGLELREQFYASIIRRCKTRHIMFLSTPHGGKASVDFLESLGMPLYKIGSGDLTNFILLSRVAKTKKPVVLSTGMASMKDVRDAVHFLRAMKSGPISIVHCTTSYPCKPEDVNLRAMVTLMHAFRLPVGYSDHSVGNQAAIMAVTLGARIYECHFTLDKRMKGPDHTSSANPKELKERIRIIRLVEVMLGSPQKKPTKTEQTEMRSAMRKSLVAVSDLPAGYIIREKDVEAKRPGTGIAPIHFPLFIGKKLKKAIHKDEEFAWSHI